MSQVDYLICRLIGHQWIHIGGGPAYQTDLDYLCHRCGVIRQGAKHTDELSEVYMPPDRRVA